MSQTGNNQEDSKHKWSFDSVGGTLLMLVGIPLLLVGFIVTIA